MSELFFDPLRLEPLHAFRQRDHDTDGGGKRCVGFVRVDQRLFSLTQVEIIPRALCLLNRLPRLRVRGDKGKSRREHEPFMGCGDDHVNAPIIHLQVNNTQTTDRVNDEDRVGLFDDIGHRLDVGNDTGRGLVLRDENSLRIRACLQGGLHLGGRYRRAPGYCDNMRDRAVDRAQFGPPLAEFTTLDGNDPISRRYDIHDSRFHTGRARADERKNIIGRLEHIAQSVQRLFQDLLELRGAVVDDRFTERRAYLGWDLGRPRR